MWLLGIRKWENTWQMTIVGLECKNEWHMTIAGLECKNGEHMAHDHSRIRM